VVAHPNLVRTPCSSVKQVQLVNLFGRIATEGSWQPESTTMTEAPQIQDRH
jgi:hypothetical protein